MFLGQYVRRQIYEFINILRAGGEALMGRMWPVGHQLTVTAIDQHASLVYNIPRD